MDNLIKLLIYTVLLTLMSFSVTWGTLWIWDHWPRIHYLTNEEIVREDIKCKNAGLKSEPLVNITYKVIRIQCMPKE